MKDKDHENQQPVAPEQQQPKKLLLNKETIRELTTSDLQEVNGGVPSIGWTKSVNSGSH